MGLLKEIPFLVTYGLCFPILIAVIAWKAETYTILHVAMYSNFVVGCLYFDTESTGLLMFTKSAFVIMSSLWIVNEVYVHYYVMLATFTVVATFHLMEE